MSSDLDTILQVYTNSYWERTIKFTKHKDLPRGSRMVSENRHFWAVKGSPMPEIFMIYGFQCEIDAFDHYTGPIDLPFECCYFECGGEHITTMDVGVDDLNRKLVLSINGILVREIAPKKYAFVFVGESPGMGFTISAYQYNEPQKQRQLVYELLVTIVQKFCAYLASNKIDQGQAKAKIYFKKEGEKKKSKIRRIIYMGKRKMVDSKATRLVDWSHSWLVRGHWRGNPGRIGKDRVGNYLVKDFTWVVPHEKGTGELIKKTRVVNEGK